jgi:hypothetical protein
LEAADILSEKSKTNQGVHARVQLRFDYYNSFCCWDSFFGTTFQSDHVFE